MLTLGVKPKVPPKAGAPARTAPTSGMPIAPHTIPGLHNPRWTFDADGLAWSVMSKAEAKAALVWTAAQRLIPGWSSWLPTRTVIEHQGDVKIVHAVHSAAARDALVRFLASLVKP